jgi:hypothetical protein
LCFDASKAQDEPLHKGENKNGIDPDDWKAVSDQRESPVFSISKIIIHPKLAAIDVGTSFDKLVLATDGILVV